MANPEAQAFLLCGLHSTEHFMLTFLKRVTFQMFEKKISLKQLSTTILQS